MAKKKPAVAAANADMAPAAEVITAPAKNAAVPLSTRLAEAAAATAAAIAAPSVIEAAGLAWCARFPGSTSLDDLAEPFRTKAKAFVAALTAGGALVTISATYRPPERAYLMHWACMIANGQDPAGVPAMAGVLIDWTCGGDTAAAKAAARAMMARYNIAFPAALASRHTQRRAVDMTIVTPVTFFPAVPSFTGPDGRTWKFGAGEKGQLYRFGAEFGVIKLVSDAPHWSDDGH